MSEVEKIETELLLAYGAMNVIKAFQKQWRYFDTIEKYDRAIDEVGITMDIEIKVLIKRLEEAKNK